MTPFFLSVDGQGGVLGVFLPPGPEVVDPVNDVRHEEEAEKEEGRVGLDPHHPVLVGVARHRGRHGLVTK